MFPIIVFTVLLVVICELIIKKKAHFYDKIEYIIYSFIVAFAVLYVYDKFVMGVWSVW
jgi:5-methylcytosine-specific restriction endonuclease McrBC regulatory subunit McrC